MSVTRPNRNRRLRRVVAGIAVAAASGAAVVSQAAPVHAAVGDPYQPTGFNLSPTSGPPGTKVTAQGTCHGGARVPYGFVLPNGDATRGDTVASASGAWTVSVSAPPGATVGQSIDFVVYCIDGNVDPTSPPVLATQKFTVTAAAAPTTTSAPSPSPSTTAANAAVSANPRFTG